VTIYTDHVKEARDVAAKIAQGLARKASDTHADGLTEGEGKSRLFVFLLLSLAVS